MVFTAAERYIEANIDVLDWSVLSRRAELSLPFLQKHRDRLDFDELCLNPNVPEAFLEANRDKLDWERLSCNRGLSEEFIIDNLECFEYLSEEVMANFSEWGLLRLLCDKFGSRNFLWELALTNCNLSDEFIEKCLLPVIEKYCNETMSSRSYKNRFGTFLSKNTGRSEQFWYRHLDLINFRELSRNPGITESLVQRLIDDGYQGRLNWDLLCSNPALTENFFQRYPERISWCFLCYNPSISEHFFQQHLDKVSWLELTQNSGISEEFFRRYLPGPDAPNQKIHENYYTWMYYLSRNPNISESFLETKIDYLSWRRGVASNPRVSLEFMQKYILPDFSEIQRTIFYTKKLLGTLKDQYRQRYQRATSYLENSLYYHDLAVVLGYLKN